MTYSAAMPNSPYAKISRCFLVASLTTNDLLMT
jgi:hypothetical protein